MNDKIKRKQYEVGIRLRILSSSLRSSDSEASDSGSVGGGGLQGSGRGSNLTSCCLGDSGGESSGVTGGDITLVGEAIGVALGVGWGVSIWSGLYRYSYKDQKEIIIS